MSNFANLRYANCGLVNGGAQGDQAMYLAKSADGSGRVTHRVVFPGVELVLSDFEALRCVETCETSTLVSIDYCLEGRFECDFGAGECVVLGTGDVSVHKVGRDGASDVVGAFPVGRYIGISVLVEPGEAFEWMAGSIGVLAVDVARTFSTVLDGQWCRAGKATRRLAAVLEELADQMRSAFDPCRATLKTVELFQLLGGHCFEEKPLQYYPRSQVRLVHDLRDRLVAGEPYTSVDEVASANGISASRLQKVFRAVYGTSVYSYVREHRLERAAVLLAEGDASVTEIALEAGYTNPSKFSSAFRQRFGMTPTDYRCRRGGAE